MNQDWILLARETRRFFASSTWVPLRASDKVEHGHSNIDKIGYISEYFGCGSVAFPAQHRELAERLSWNEIGIGHHAGPYAYEDGHYSPVDEYQRNDKEPVGVELVFQHDQPVVGGHHWILNPDLVIALRLIKEGKHWVRPEEDFVVVARESFDEEGQPSLLEIKREFLLDYLAARGLSLRLSYYRQRVENVAVLEQSPYAGLVERHEQRDGGRFELRVGSLSAIFGGTWAAFRVWRNDIDPEDDAPVMGPSTEHNTESEQRQGERRGPDGVRVEGEFWRDEWIHGPPQSLRVRGDEDPTRPQFIVETDGSRVPSRELDDEDIGRWLFFRAAIVSDLLGRRGFSLQWYTRETGSIRSTSGYEIHFGLNASDLITVYAYDVAKLPTWEQHVWAAHNVVPEGKVSAELLASQTRTQPAGTKAAEVMLFKTLRQLDASFQAKHDIPLFTHEIDEAAAMPQISRFASKDLPSLLRLAKELVRVFSDRLNVKGLRQLATHADKEKLGSNKLLQDVLAQKVGAEEARRLFGVIAGAYDMRLGDAHPTSSTIADALALAELNTNASFLRQGEQLIYNFGRALWQIGGALFADATPGDN
jgi:hypothetical protein